MNNPDHMGAYCIRPERKRVEVSTVSSALSVVMHAATLEAWVFFI